MSGEIALRAGRPDLAAELTGKALDIHGDASIILVTYGAALGAQEKLVEATAVYGRALALDPKCAAAHCNLGAALHALGEPDEAADGFRRALALKPDDVEALSNLGNALRDLGRLDEAIGARGERLTCSKSSPRSERERRDGLCV